MGQGKFHPGPMNEDCQNRYPESTPSARTRNYVPEIRYSEEKLVLADSHNDCCPVFDDC